MERNEQKFLEAYEAPQVEVEQGFSASVNDWGKGGHLGYPSRGMFFIPRSVSIGMFSSRRKRFLVSRIRRCLYSWPAD